jgi:hypothetical protein
MAKYQNTAQQVLGICETASKELPKRDSPVPARPVGVPPYLPSPPRSPVKNDISSSATTPQGKLLPTTLV